jgi:hypothetical protein
MARQQVGSVTNRRRAASWSVIDQGVSSLTNLAGVILSARLLDTTGFGRFAVIYGVCVLILGAGQSFLSQPLVLTRGRDDAPRLVRSALRAALVLGSLFAVGLVLAAVLAPQARAELVVTAACMPLLLVGDTFRFGCAVLGRMDRAALVDIVWLVLLVAGVVVLSTSAVTPEGWHLMGVWAGSGAAAGALAWLLAPRGSHVSLRSLRSFTDKAYLGYRFSVEFIAVRGANQLMALSLGVLVAVEAVGALRGVQTLFGPINVLVQAAGLFGAPLVIGLTARRRGRFLVLIGVALGLLAAAMTACLLVLPPSLGRVLLGETWSDTGGLLLPLGLQAVGVAVLAAAMLGVRVVEPRLSLRIQLTSTSCFLVLFGAGVWLGGVEGAAWGFGVGTLVQASLAVTAYRWASRHSIAPDRRSLGEEVRI